MPVGTLPDPRKLEYFAGLGVTEVALRLPSAPADTVLRVLDEHARLVPQWSTAP